ncbi:hypothetical protein WJX82_005297 [Trebouxia sp. C0006]
MLSVIRRAQQQQGHTVSSIPATASDSVVAQRLLAGAVAEAPQSLAAWNSSEKEVSHVVSKSATGKGPARVDTVGTARGLSLVFGEDKAYKDRGLEQAWGDLKLKLKSGFPALFYGHIPYLPVYAAAGVQIQFGRLLPNGVVEQGGRVLLVQRLAHRIKCDVVIKDIEDTATFYAGFGHSFQSIKAAHMLL